MKFIFEGRSSDSPFVESIWRTQSEGSGSFTSVAESHWGLVVTNHEGKTTLTIRGPETKATPAPVPKDAEFFGIIFKLGSFMPHLPASILVDGETNLPEANSKSFWFHSSVWEFPTYDNADIFLARLAREGLLVSDPVVEAVLRDQQPAWSVRTVRRRFMQVTGITYSMIRQIERAKQAMALLQRGIPILDVVYETGYFDQPHLTRSLKHLVGQTPAQILTINQPK